MLPRVADGLSFLYLDMMRIIQDDTGLIAFPADPGPERPVAATGQRRIRIPTAALNCLLLGPGTSITAPALSTLARHGTTVVCTGSAGVRSYAGITPAGQSSRWLEAQATAWAAPDLRRDVAERMYRTRFGELESAPQTEEPASIARLRGLEGQRMKALYRLLARQYGLRAFKRSYDPDDWDSQDPINLALSAANTCLYGIAHAAVIALGCTPGLGFVHTGTAHSFVYDIADLYKAELSIPLAFSLHRSTDPEGEARRAFRERLRLFRLLPRIVRDIQNLLDPAGAPARTDGEAADREDVELVSLWDPVTGSTPGGTNYAGEDGSSWPA